MNKKEAIKMNVISYNGKFYEARQKVGGLLQARRLNKDFSINQRLRDCNFLPVAGCEFLKGSINEVPEVKIN
jgi:hypothetical protein